VLLDAAALGRVPREIGLRALGSALMRVSGEPYRPRFERLERLFPQPEAYFSGTVMVDMVDSDDLRLHWPQRRNQPRIRGNSNAREAPIGLLPHEDAIDLSGMDFPKERLFELVFPVGLVSAAVFGRWIVPTFGWQYLFFVGGVPAWRKT
jgi:hypothetical protein